MAYLARSNDIGQTEKEKRQEAIKLLNKWLVHERGTDTWEFDYYFNGSGGNYQPQDLREERHAIRQAVLQSDGWKGTSHVWTSSDGGLRPVEVGRAPTSWVDTTNDVLRIPKMDSARNEGNWTVTLTDRTSTALDRWLTERVELPQYEYTDLL